MLFSRQSRTDAVEKGGWVVGGATGGSGVDARTFGTFT